MNPNIPQIPIQNIKRMNKDDFFKRLDGRKLFDGKADQIKEWSAFFIIRKDAMGFYIAWKDQEGPVIGTPNFDQWMDAKYHLSTNWKRFVDEEFERQVLIGSKEGGTDDNSKDNSLTEGDQ